MHPLQTPSLGAARRYGSALLVCLAACLVRLLLDPRHLDRPHYALFVAAVLVVAYYAGFWPSVLTAAASALVILYFFIPPPDSFAIPTRADGDALGLFVAVSLLVAGLAQGWHAVLRRTEAEKAGMNQVLQALEAVLVVDNGGYITYANDAAGWLMGIPTGYLEGRQVGTLGGRFLDEDGRTLPDADAPLARALRGETVWGVWDLDAGSGGPFAVAERPKRVLEVRSAPLQGGHGGAALMLVARPPF